MKIILFLLLSLFLSPYIAFSQDVNVIMTHGTVLKGNLIEKNAGSIVLEDADGNNKSISKADIKMVFDAATGDQVDLTPPPPAPPASYRPRFPEATGPKNALSIDALDLAFGSFRVSYERSLTDWFALKVEAAYSPNYLWYDGISYWSAALYARFYFGRRIMWFYSPPENLAGPFFEFGIGAEGATLNSYYSDPSGSYQFNGYFAPAPMVRIGFGNKIMFDGSGIFIEPRFGAEISTGSWNYTSSGTGYYTSYYSSYFPFVQGFGESFFFGVDLGYAF